MTHMETAAWAALITATALGQVSKDLAIVIALTALVGPVLFNFFMQRIKRT